MVTSSKWKQLPRYWPFVRGIRGSPGNSHHKGQWCGALIFSMTSAWINGWVNNREAGDLRRHRAHYDVIVMITRYDIILLYHAVFRPFVGSEKGAWIWTCTFDNDMCCVSLVCKSIMSCNAIIIRSGRFTSLIISSVYYTVGTRCSMVKISWCCIYTQVPPL